MATSTGDHTSTAIIPVNFQEKPLYKACPVSSLFLAETTLKILKFAGFEFSKKFSNMKINC